MARETIILTRADLAQHIDLAAVIPAIERCMADFEKGLDLLPPKYIVEVGGGIAACIAGYTVAANALSMKLGQERKANAAKGLPTICATINLYEPDTGELLMITEGVLPTMYRTGAAAAVSVKHLARKDARTLGVIGAGQLGHQCLRTVASVRSFERAMLYDVNLEQARQLAKKLQASLPCVVQVAADLESLCREADVVCTATNSTSPIVRADWIKPGTHLACMGADLHTKIECDMDLLPRCRLIADQVEHCLQRGEVSQAVEKGVLPRTCFAGNLGQVITGKLPGRRSPAEITLFDAVGMGVQDTTIAKSIFEQAVEKKLGLRLAFA